MPRGTPAGPRLMRRLPDWIEPQPYESIRVRPLSPTIGAVVSGVDLAPLPDVDGRDELHRALLEHKVLFFRDQELTPDDHIAFARTWGPLEVHPVLGQGSQPEIVRFEKDGTDRRSARTSGNENTWHSDVSWRETPSLGSILHCIDCPETGGDTLFADMHAAYDNLDARTRDRIDGMTATHSFMRTFGLMLEGSERDEMAAKFPDVHHPVVRTHPETKRKLLYVNMAFTSWIDGLDRAESEPLLARLCHMAEVPEFQCRWHWERNDVAFWDNRAVQHYATSDYWPAHRVMERVTIIGDRPY